MRDPKKLITSINIALNIFLPLPKISLQKILQKKNYKKQYECY